MKFKSTDLSWILLTLVAAGISIYSMGDFRVRQANSGSSDDNPVFYVKYYNNSHIYEGDIIDYVLEFKAGSSMMNWLPIMVSRLHVDSEFVVWMMVFLQTFLLFISLFLLTLTLTDSHFYAWIVVFFIYAVRPWEWDLAVHPVSLVVAYPAHLALPFVLLAFAFVLKNRLVPAIILLIVAALTHPGLALYAVAILGIYFLLTYRLHELKQLIVAWVALMGVVAICVGPGLLIQGNVQSVLPVDEYMLAVRNNVHMAPWVAYNTEADTRRWLDNIVFNFLGVVALMVLSLAYLQQNSKSYTRLLISAVIVTIPMIFLQPLAVNWQVVPIIQLIPMRFSRLLIMLSFPPIVSYLLTRLQHARWLTISTVILLVFYILVLNTMALWIFYLVLLLADLLDQRINWIPELLKSTPFSDVFYRVGYFTMILMLGVWLWNSSRGRVIVETEIFVGSTVFILLLRAYLSHRRLVDVQNFTKYVVLPLIAVLCVSLAIVQASGLRQESQTQARRDIYAAQLWAKENTPQDAAFILLRLPWRTYAERPVVEGTTTMKYVYTRDARLAAWNDRLLAHYDLKEEFRSGVGWNEQKRQEIDKFNSYTEEEVIAFANEFGGDYLIRLRQNPILDFEVAYENDTLVIYQIPDV